MPISLSSGSRSACRTICTDPRSAARRRRPFESNPAHYDFDFGGDLLAGRRVEIVDCGDVLTTPATSQDNPTRITAVIRKILERRAIPIVLGGEHSIPIPVMQAYEGHGPIFIV